MQTDVTSDASFLKIIIKGNPSLQYLKSVDLENQDSC